MHAKKISDTCRGVVINVLFSVFFVLVISAAVILFPKIANHQLFNFNPNKAISLGIHVSETLENQSRSALLEVSKEVDHDGVTFDVIQLDEVLASEGEYIDLEHQYLAYSFYIHNTGSQAISIQHGIRFIGAYDWMVDAVKILVIEDQSDMNLYQKNIGTYEHLDTIETKLFQTDNIVFSSVFNEFQPETFKSYRVIVWLENFDEDLLDDNKVYQLKMDFWFQIEFIEEELSRNHILLASSDEKLWIAVGTKCNVHIEINYMKQNQQS